MKFFFLLLLLIYSATAFDNSYIQHLNQKIFDSQDALLLDKQEIDYLRTLLFLSYQRSNISLQVRTLSLKHLKQAWEIDRNIAMTMRDPLNPVPFNDCWENYNSNQLQELYKQHFIIGQDYSTMVFELPKQTMRVRQIVQDIRSQATAIRFKAILMAAADIKKIYELACKASALLRKDYKKKFIKKILHRNCFDFLNIRKLFEDLYINLDQTANTTSLQCWRALTLYEDAVFECWKTIESARTEYYKMLYENLSNRLSAL